MTGKENSYLLQRLQHGRNVAQLHGEGRQRRHGAHQSAQRQRGALVAQKQLHLPRRALEGLLHPHLQAPPSAPLTTLLDRPALISYRRPLHPSAAAAAQRSQKTWRQSRYCCGTWRCVSCHDPCCIRGRGRSCSPCHTLQLLAARGRLHDRREGRAARRRTCR